MHTPPTPRCVRFVGASRAEPFEFRRLPPDIEMFVVDAIVGHAIVSLMISVLGAMFVVQKWDAPRNIA